MNIQPAKRMDSLSTDTLAQFVSDAADTEVAVFTLKQTESQLERETRTYMDPYKEQVRQKTAKVKSLQESLEEERRVTKCPMSPERYVERYHPEIEASADPRRKPWFDWEEFIGLLVGVCGMTGLVAALPVYFIVFIVYQQNLGEISFETHAPLVFRTTFIVLGIIIALAAIIVIIRAIYIYRKEILAHQMHMRGEKSRYQEAITTKYQEYLDSLKEGVEFVERNLSRAEEELEEAQQIFDEKQRQYDFLKSQLADTVSKRKELEKQMQRLYNMGVIPPDYRYMDCVLVLNFIFRNGLADTMREAIANYEQRVFRGEVIKGMDSILRSINNLGIGMSMIATRLDDINRNVTTMSKNLNSFALSTKLNQQLAQASADRLQATTERLVEETQLGRYATEQLNNTTKRIAYYNDLLPN